MYEEKSEKIFKLKADNEFLIYNISGKDTKPTESLQTHKQRGQIEPGVEEGNCTGKHPSRSHHDQVPTLSLGTQPSQQRLHDTYDFEGAAAGNGRNPCHYSTSSIPSLSQYNPLGMNQSPLKSPCRLVLRRSSISLSVLTTALSLIFPSHG